MNKMPKNVRFKKFGKYLVELIASTLEEDFNEKQNEIIKKVNNISAEYLGYSITAMIKVSSSSVVELALAYFNERMTQTEWNTLYAQFDSEDIIFQNKTFDVGSLTPKLYINNESVSLIDKLAKKYKGNKIKSLKDREVIDIVLFSYCKNNNLI